MDHPDYYSSYDESLMEKDFYVNEYEYPSSPSNDGLEYNYYRDDGSHHPSDYTDGYESDERLPSSFHFRTRYPYPPISKRKQIMRYEFNHSPFGVSVKILILLKTIHPL